MYIIDVNSYGWLTEIEQKRKNKQTDLPKISLTGIEAQLRGQLVALSGFVSIDKEGKYKCFVFGHVVGVGLKERNCKYTKLYSCSNQQGGFMIHVLSWLLTDRNIMSERQVYTTPTTLSAG